MAAEGSGFAGQPGAGDGVLRRLLAARDKAESGTGKAPHLPTMVPPTPARAAATAVGRAADKLYRLGVQPVAVTPGALTLAELPELLPMPSLLVVLQGPGDLLGVAALCPETVTALIEIQALGRVTARPAEKRRLTRSDAMICADFINALMAELATEMAGLEGFDTISGFRYATYLDDPRPLALMLEDKPYRSLAFQLRLGGSDTRDSTIFLALPQQPAQDRAPRAHPGLPPIAVAAPAEAPRNPAQDTAPTPTEAGTPGIAGDLAMAMAAAPVELVGVLCRRRMSLGELRGLATGKLVPLPRVSLADATLETLGGQVLATGKFGEAEGCHALRLRDPLAIPDADAGPRKVTMPPMRDAAGTGEPAMEIDAALPMDDLAHPDPFRHDEAAAADRTALARTSAARPSPNAAKAG